ncbi:MAG TPA: flagellar hook capping FlgD N-terminal domain-containing protein [Terracidiphilus sp.]|nr:flagellar hook capping FlgD N-terminal domain-containing protein [Terracidiphilus sp.]
MAAMAGIFRQAIAAGDSQSAQAKNLSANASSGSGSSNNTSSSTATVTANDFLTLLVTEMQNQDPTATTDPNEYINQLVQVNSLEQLIGINQTLNTDLSAPTADTSSSTPTASTQSETSAANPASNGSSTAAAFLTDHHRAAFSQPFQSAPGNLSIPAPSAAAQRVAHALTSSAAGRLNASGTTPLNNRP